MKRFYILLLFIFISLIFFSAAVFAMNPFITHIYTADPSAHVFENRVYVYPSHDKDNAIWFDMEDYHVFSSADLINWVDHGVVFSYKSLDPDGNGNYDWIGGPDPNGDYSQTKMHPRLWAPDCAFKNGTYYFYYCARDKNIQSVKDSNGNWPKEQFKIGVATSKSPCGPFVPVKYNGVQSYIPKSYSIDPCVFVEDDEGRAVMVFGGESFGGLNHTNRRGPLFAELKDNMIEFNGNPVLVTNDKGQPLTDWFEASWIHKRKNPSDGKTWYYLSYPNNMHDHEANEGGVDRSEIHYAMNTSLRADGWIEKNSSNPRSQLLAPGSAGTNHGSIVEFKGKWYGFFQGADMSDNSMKRSICVYEITYTNENMNEIKDLYSPGGTSAYSRIKAQFLSLYDKNSELLDKNAHTEVCSGGDIGKCLSSIKDGYMIYTNLDFGSIGSKSLEIQYASKNQGGNIVVGIGAGGHGGIWMVEELGNVEVASTGGWQNWRTVTCDLDQTVYGKNDIIFIFEDSFDTGKGLFNINSFRFKPAANIPIGHSIAFKSKNPNCIDNNGYIGQKYLSVHTVSGWGSTRLPCADRDAVGGAWEKFSILAKDNNNGDFKNLIQLNSSNNGKNLALYTSNSGPTKYIYADGGDYFSTPDSRESIRWKSNNEGTITFQHKYSPEYSKYLSVDSTNHNPALLVADKDKIQTNERFYAEVADAPIGCVVAFKSLNPNCKDINGDIGQAYLSIASDYNYELCANMPQANDNLKKFLVVDAGNGYIALKSLNNNQYISIDNPNYLAIANGADRLNSYDKFQWVNNGDGTIALKSIKKQKYVRVSTSNGNNNPAKCYADRDAVDLWEKFYCQIVK